MKKTPAPKKHDLADHDIVSKPFEPPVSALAMTGIDFAGLEYTVPVATRPWTANVRPQRGALARHKR